MVTRYGFLAVLGLESGARGLDELEPYPCPTATLSCPDGRACEPGVGCVAPYVDGPCDEHTDCSVAGAGIECLAGACNPDRPDSPCATGMCAPVCDTASACTPDRVCTAGGNG